MSSTSSSVRGISLFSAADQRLSSSVYQGTILKAVSYLKLPINSDERLVEYSELRIDEVRSISLGLSMPKLALSD